LELKFRIQRLVTNVKTPGVPATQAWWQKLLATIRSVWGPQIRRIFPEFPRLNINQIPDLDTMFTIASDGTVSFRTGTPPPGKTMDQVITDVRDGPVLDPAMRFHDWMRSMILWSNNKAAGRVIDTIGFPYINWVLREASFFKPSPPGPGPAPVPGLGLWLSGNYDNRDWVPRVDLMPLTARGKAHYKATTNAVGTCHEVARLLTLAGLGKLFDQDPGTCGEMLTLMTKNFIGDTAPPVIPGGPGDNTFIGNAIGLQHGDTVSSKIGLGDPPNPPNPPVPADQKGTHDCAIVTRTVGVGAAAHEIRYVAVVLGSYSMGTDFLAFNNAARACDAAIKELHP
jgi:hypothetical protein